jgi:hypothetical protein
MTPCETQQRLARELEEAFARLDQRFELPPDILQWRREYTGAWSVAEHLEHVCLANHFLMLTITKGCAKARRRAAEEPVPEGESDLSPLAPIALPGAFPWEVPAHMLPTGRRNPAATRAELKNQRERTLELLAGMPNGEGRLCRIRMSVHSLGEIDMYQWLYFLVQHARYHLALVDEGISAAEKERH